MNIWFDVFGHSARNYKSVQDGIKLKDSEAYLVDRHILNPPQVVPGGVGAECDYDVGSLILILITFLPKTFLVFGGRAWAAATLHLSAHIFDEPTP
jgi:hypothetical protein